MSRHGRHSRGGEDPEVDHVDSLRGQTGGKGSLHERPRPPGVAAHQERWSHARSTGPAAPAQHPGRSPPERQNQLGSQLDARGAPDAIRAEAQRHVAGGPPTYRLEY